MRSEVGTNPSPDSVGQIAILQDVLKVLCEITTMRFSVVARVTEKTWIACAVEDRIDFGLKPGQHLDINTTFCRDVRLACRPIVIDQATTDSLYRDHPTPKLYGFESYISVPIVLSTGEYFGNLCALDPAPIIVSDPRIVLMFESFSRLAAQKIETYLEGRHRDAEEFDHLVVANLRGLFIAMLADDLRGSLGTLQATSDAQRALSNRTLTEFADEVSSSVADMHSLIDAVLHQARVGVRGGLPIRLQKVEDLESRLAAVVDKTLAAYPDRKVISNIAIGCVVRCDPRRIEQLTEKLLVNALQHGFRDGPVSVVALVEDSELTIEVWNEGSHLSPQQQADLLQPFWLNRNFSSRIGLGLQICAAIVEAHRGRMEVKSSGSEGTHLIARMRVDLAYTN